MALLVSIQWNSPLLFAQSSPSENQEPLPYDSLLYVESRLPSYRNEKSAIQVFISLSEVCMLSQYYAKEFEMISQKFRADSIAFFGIFPNPFSTENEISAFVKANNLHFPMARDIHGAFCKASGITKTPEVVVLKNQTIVFQGKMDDFYVAIGRHRSKTNQKYLQKALEALIAGQKPEPSKIAAVGCQIDFRLWNK